MARLRIKFTDADGEEKVVNVDSPEFTIGRHSASDLPIVDSRLSRDHVMIERRGDAYFISDRGSSNGTKLNGVQLIEPTEIRNGDKADLGGGVVLQFEVEEEPKADQAEFPAAAPAAGQAPATVEESSAGKFPIGILLVAPLLGFLVLGIALAAVYMLRGRDSAEVSNKVESSPYGVDDDPIEHRPSPSRTPISASPDDNSVAPTPVSTGTPTLPVGPAADSKVEQNAAAFLRRIAQNDSRAFVTGEQARIVEAKIKLVSGSPALAENLKAAKRGASEIRNLAMAKNIKPQLLAGAALAKLGGTRGDVIQTARSMADTLERLNTQIGSELADDAVLLVAAYDQGESGDFMRLRNMLQDLATKSPESSRAIRSIWFLHKNGKITDAEFEMALRFLAIGTISQNPADFGVNAEALIL
jgi:hypothetical protein